MVPEKREKSAKEKSVDKRRSLSRSRSKGTVVVMTETEKVNICRLIYIRKWIN